MDQVELLRQWSQATIENAALKAEVAGLKARLTDAHDKIASLQQFLEGEAHMRRTAQAALEAANSAADCALKAQESTRSMLEHFQGEAETFRKELMRRGADDPRKPKPPCETALAVLDLVRKWDRDACVADLRKQRVQLLQDNENLKKGRNVFMDRVLQDMKENGWSMGHGDLDTSLHDTLGELYYQLYVVYKALPRTQRHAQWEEHPLRYFTLEPDSGDEMDDEESMEGTEQD